MRAIAFVFAAFLLIVVPVVAQQSAPPPPPPSQKSFDLPIPASMPEGRETPGAQMVSCESLSRKMTSSWDAMDSRLAVLVNDMNQAGPSEKVDRMASVINELVSQRKRMREETVALMPQLVDHVLQHVQLGIVSGMSRSMAACPVLKENPSRTGSVDSKR